MKTRPGLASCVLASLALCGPAAAAPVADALQRPALMVREPARAVLLAASRAGQRIVAVGERGVVVLSDDEGQHWRQSSVPVSVSLTSVRFADARQGVAAGHGGMVLTTSDGGETWVKRLDGRQAAQLVLEAARAAGDAAAVKAAEQLMADGPDKPFFDVLMLDARRLLVVGAYGLALASEDGGARWSSWSQRLDNPKGLHLYAVRRDGDSVLIAGEQGLLLASGDGGASFRRLASPYKGSWFTAELLSPREWVVAGLRGNVWRSGDAGASWSQLASNMPATITASARDTRGDLILANQAGFVLRLREGVLAPVNARPLPMPSALLAGVPGALFVLGVAGIVPVAGGNP